MFLVTWIANLLGAAGVYLAARRYGRRLFASPTGRRLLAPRSLAVIERGYLRFGVVGIFISRFLPGIRAVVPPFAGLVGLGAMRTFVPMGLASAIWYGGITILGALIGAEWGAHHGAHRQRQPDAGHRDPGRGRGAAATWYLLAPPPARGASACGTPPVTRWIPPRPRFWPAPTSPKARHGRPRRSSCSSWRTPIRCSRPTTAR